jgi:hypothetical protein
MQQRNGLGEIERCIHVVFDHYNAHFAWDTGNELLDRVPFRP